MSILNPTPEDKLVDALGRPYFLWDTDTTLDQFRALLRSEDPQARAYWIGKLMRQAKPDDVFTFVTLSQISDNWSELARYLGHSRAFWVWILTRWGVLESTDTEQDLDTSAPSAEVMPRSSRDGLAKKLQAEVFVRARWTCFYCGEPVLFSPALKALEKLGPNRGAYHKNGRADAMAAFLLERCACVDHHLAVANGGTDDLDNLRCACWECNTKKSSSKNFELSSRRTANGGQRVPEGWDGLLSVLRSLEPDSEWLQHFP